ncbi:transcriptional regulator [Burkholderia sp. HI2761]|uniref:helix-turn-helix domain-containing protein n=1 Tax=unclassified Burkholderia TaxID=2613784 RepID=UPI000B79D2FD|nr:MULTISPECIES: helix-turn-helix transcriptional regulator [unclassified Burkholderia]MPV60143.1 helix-turn-helix domain-containing protein [Burkholderia sp. BE24]OXJ22794.1 transcriptional regulator [Burkholderia sp. HI2761]
MNSTATLHSPSPPAGRASGVGPLLRTWRQRRRLSQMALALDAEVSARHLSFVESGRAQPSREMVLHLAERLDVPLRERNALLVAAGFAPLFRERPFSDPQLDAARHAVEAVLRGHEPYPALAVDRHWTLLTANRMLGALVAQANPALLQPPVNVLRLSLHPDGLASQIVNWHEWRAHILHRLQRQIDASGDRTLHALRDELAAYPAPAGQPDDTHARTDFADIAVPLRLRTARGELTFFSTTTVFGTPVDVTLSELAIEAFFPANPETVDAMRALADALPAE